MGLVNLSGPQERQSEDVRGGKRGSASGVRVSLAGVFALTLTLTLLCGAIPVFAAPDINHDLTKHSDPLNFDSLVRDGYEHLYNLDYDGAITRFELVLKAHPQEPMAYGYLQMATVFRELYHQDLLDTTYYAHDSFLTSKRNVPVPAATR
jgi:outer membrane protein assembly factor BamD (BamD/ComL family)